MFDLLTYEIALWKLQRKKYSIGKWYSKCRDKAQKENESQDEIRALAITEMAEIEEIDDIIIQIQHRLLWKQGEKFLIPNAKYMTIGAEWEQSKFSGLWRLNQVAIANLKDAVRQEQRDRRERWLGWITALTGLTGALIGLISVL